MIVKNEEKCIERCLTSVQGIVDEIIIIDTGSTDSTISIARKYTEKIYSFKWVNDFSAARNESIKYATSEYILVLDADEHLEEGTNIQKDLIKNYDYYVFNINNQMTMGRSFNHTAVRLFRNHINLYYENRLHEHLNIIETDTKYISGVSDCLIYHAGYADETLLEEKKYNRNLPLMELEVKEKPTPYNLFNMGKTYFGIEEYKKSIDYFKLAFPKSQDKVFLPELLTKLAYALSEFGQAEEGLAILKDATVLYPQETEMKYIQGLIYIKAGYYKDAEECFLKCLVMGDQGSVITEGSGSYMAHLQLAELYESDGELDKSYTERLKAMEIKGDSIQVLHDYLELTMKINQSLEEIKSNIEEFYKIDSIHKLQNLMNTLYGLRHPLLAFYLKTHKINAQAHIRVVAEVYSKHYEEAKRILNEVDNIKNEIGQDIFILSYVLKDDDLLDGIQFTMNLGQKEVKIIKQLLNNQQLSGPRSSTLDKMFLELCRKLIILEEFELFQNLAEKLIEYDMKYKMKLSTILSDFKFDELAIDMLIEMFKTNSNNVEVIRLLGDLCFRNNYLEDAQLFYSKLMLLDSSYGTYERSYKLYKTVNDAQAVDQIEKEISQRFPVVSWVRPA